MTCHQMKMLRTQLQILTWRSAYTSFFTVWKNHTKKSFSFAYSGNYLFHKSLQFLEKQNHGRELLIIVQS